ncbi:MAG: hypothetical protein FJ015_01760 [Chloroflexi bacterium]|nr:hypothetical protein [Chloroflexota bacterium]
MARFSDSCPQAKTVRIITLKVKKLIKPAAGKRPLGPDNELLIDRAFPITHTINLADRYPHRMSQLGQVVVVSITQLKYSRPDYHGGTFLYAIWHIL